MSEWICARCQAEVEAGFEVCWQCGATRDGVENNDFLPEIDAATEPADYIQTIRCEDCGYRGKILFSRYRYGLPSLLLTPLLIVSVIGIVPLLIWLRLTQALRIKRCAKCRGTAIYDWRGEISRDDETIWLMAHSAEPIRFQRQRMRLLWLILGTLVCLGIVPMIWSLVWR